MLCEGCGDLFEKYFVDQVKFADGVSICNACGGPEGKIYLALYWIAPFPKTRLMSNGMRRIQICSKERGDILDELQSLLTNPLIL